MKKEDKITDFDKFVIKMSELTNEIVLYDKKRDPLGNHFVERISTFELNETPQSASYRREAYNKLLLIELVTLKEEVEKLKLTIKLEGNLK